MRVLFSFFSFNQIFLRAFKKRKNWVFRISELICLDKIKYMYIIDVNFIPYFFTFKPVLMMLCL